MAPEIQEQKASAQSVTLKVDPPNPARLKELENRFKYHAPFDDLPLKYEAIRSALFQNARLILLLTPQSAEQTTAIRKLEEAMFWANAAIARNTKPPAEETK